MAAATATLVEVAAHCTPDDCWVVVDGKAYDVTSFLRQHPGGAAALSRPGRAGTDVSEHFHRIGHSEGAKRKLASMYVMDLQTDEEAAVGKGGPSSPPLAPRLHVPAAPEPEAAAAASWVARRDTALPLLAVQPTKWSGDLRGGGGGCGGKGPGV
eukprot:SAG25_NODE_1400_length_3115_cov_2.560676_5_plen_155_part_00